MRATQMWDFFMTNITTQILENAGTHFGYSRTRRHPTALPFLGTVKERIDMFNIDHTNDRLSAAITFVSNLAQSGKTVLFVGGKNEVQAIVRAAAERAGQPYVAGRWIGGTLTNYKNIRTRLDLLERLSGERDRGELGKYTKKERLMIDRRIDKLISRFGGIAHMAALPAALFVVDTRHEHIAVREANQLNIPVVGLASSDCDFSVIQYPIPGNDTSVRSVRTVSDAISESYQDGKRVAPAAQPAPSVTA
jgi:small subunit ribosomal protein S2